MGLLDAESLAGLGLRTLGELERGRGAGRRVPSGCAELDAALGGGWPPGALGELVVPEPGRGGQSLIERVVVTARRQRTYMALVEAGGVHFDPEHYRGGAERWLEHLLLVRGADTEQALRAADILCRDAHFAFVVVDLIARPVRELQRVRGALWYRLQRLKGNHGGLLLVLAPVHVVAGAHFSLQIDFTPALDDLDAAWDALGARIGAHRQEAGLLRHVG